MRRREGGFAAALPSLTLGCRTIDRHTAHQERRTIRPPVAGGARVSVFAAGAGEACLARVVSVAPARVPLPPGTWPAC